MNAASSSPPGGIIITTDRLPMVDIRVRGTLTVATYREQLAYLATVLRREKPPFTLLADMRDFNPFNVSAKDRKEVSAIWHTDRDLWIKVIVGEARVVVNPLTRGLLTAIDWLTSTGKWPCKQFSNMIDAEDWLRERHAAAIESGR